MSNESVKNTNEIDPKTYKGDPNMIVIKKAHDNMTFTNILDTKIKLTGFPWLKQNGDFNRIPNSIMSSLPEQLQWVAPQPSGGMLHFKTNSRKLSIHVKLLRNETSIQCPQNLLSGFDVYVNSGKGLMFESNLNVNDNPMEFIADYPRDLPDCTDKEQCSSPDGLNELKIYLPLQNPIGEIEIGLDDGAIIEEPSAFDIDKPILFYGSSITCGFCASRPGMTYPAQITRALNAEMINLGFGGGARGEVEVGQSIGSLDLSCVVIDYDCNAPTPEFLWDTHYSFYEAIRKSNPSVPIIIVSGPFYWKHTEWNETRKEAIEATYTKAKANGDQNVYFIDGGKMFPECTWADCTTDCLHPNDLGFMYMRQAIEPEIRRVLNV